MCLKSLVKPLHIAESFPFLLMFSFFAAKLHIAALPTVYEGITNPLLYCYIQAGDTCISRFTSSQASVPSCIQEITEQLISHAIYALFSSLFGFISHFITIFADD